MTAATPPWPLFHLDCRSLQYPGKVRLPNAVEVFWNHLTQPLGFRGQFWELHQCLRSQTLMLPRPCLTSDALRHPRSITIGPKIRSFGTSRLSVVAIATTTCNTRCLDEMMVWRVR